VPKFDYSNWVNWLLVIVGCLVVANAAHTLFLSQLQAEEGVNRVLGPALNSSPDPVADAMPSVNATEEESFTGFERLAAPQPPQNASPKRRARPAQQAPVRVPNSEADRLGL